jgi:hypothetical protein
MNTLFALIIVSLFAGWLAAFIRGPLARRGLRWMRRNIPRVYAFVIAITEPSFVLASVYSGNFPSVFHKILGAVWTDEAEKSEPVWKQYLQEKSTIKKFFDDIELVEPDLWNETDEGADLDLDDYSQGITKRYEAKKFSKRLIIPEELEEDSQYDEITDAVRMLQNTCELTQDYDAVGLLNDAFNGTTDSGLAGDGVAVCSGSHLIRGGATVSNVISPTLSPSNVAIQAMLISAETMPGTNGRIRPIKLEKVVGSANLKWRFKEILKSEQKDDTANHTINSIKGSLSSEPVSVPFMSSTTNYFGITNVKRGAMFIWRRKPRFRNSNVETSETKQYTGSARWTKGVSNWRYFIGVNA